MARVGGVLGLTVNGLVLQVKGDFDYVPTGVKRTPIVGKDGLLHGYTEEPESGSIEGTITDRADLDTKAMYDTTDATVTLKLGNGKTIAGTNCFYSGDRKGNTAEGELTVKWNGNVQEVA